MADFCGKVLIADDRHQEPFDTLRAALAYAATCQNGEDLRVVAADSGESMTVDELLSCDTELLLSWPR